MKTTNLSCAIIGIALVSVSLFTSAYLSLPTSMPLAILYWAYKVSLPFLGIVFLAVAIIKKEKNDITVIKLLYTSRIFLLLSSNIVAIFCLWLVSFLYVDKPSPEVAVINISKGAFEASMGFFLAAMTILLATSIIYALKKNLTKQ